MLKQIENYDWQEAFLCGMRDLRCIPNDNTPQNAFDREDVKTILGIYEGQNDGESWRIYGQLNDGRFFYLEAWCDYTGWGCQDGGSSTVASSREDIISIGMPDIARERFGIVL